MEQQIYGSPEEALQATSEFYGTEEGFQYSEDLATTWISESIKVPAQGRVLDLCCGDGIWSRGFQNINANLELFGVDISEGAITKARELLATDESHFRVVDAESSLPFDDGFFDLIFARGPGLYNQHSMDRPQTVAVIERWHEKLAPVSGRFYSIFASTPHLMGTYTPMEKVKLPYNRCPRQTEAVDFRGGKYHHTIQSFLTPFWKASGVDVVSYAFTRNQHILVTRRQPEDPNA